MHGRFSFGVALCRFVLQVSPAVAQQPPQPTWFNSQAAELAAALPSAPLSAEPQRPPYPSERAPVGAHVESQKTTASLETDVLQQPSFDQQLAALGKRVDALE